MKLSLTNLILYVVLGGCLLLAMLFCVQTVSRERDLRHYKTRGDFINAWIPSVRSLAAECVEYGKRNPSINPVLEQAGILPGKSAPAPAPAAKPAGK